MILKMSWENMVTNMKINDKEKVNVQRFYYEKSH
jgi:hypothetical protein